MACPKCNGVVGPHSDYCLDCGYDTARFTLKDWLIVGIMVAIFVYGFGSMTR